MVAVHSLKCPDTVLAWLVARRRQVGLPAVPGLCELGGAHRAQGVRRRWREVAAPAPVMAHPLCAGHQWLAGLGHLIRHPGPAGGTWLCLSFPQPPADLPVTRPYAQHGHLLTLTLRFSGLQGLW